jgi:hypothetical protein
MRLTTQQTGGNTLTNPPLDTVLKKHLPKEFINQSNSRLLERDLALAMGISRQGVNLWFKKEQIPLDKIDALMSIPNNTLVLEDLTPFCSSLLDSLALTMKHPIKR